MSRKRTMILRWVMTTLERYVFSLRFGSIEICFFIRDRSIFFVSEMTFSIFTYCLTTFFQFFLVTFYKGIFLRIVPKIKGRRESGALILPCMWVFGLLKKFLAKKDKQIHKVSFRKYQRYSILRIQYSRLSDDTVKTFEISAFENNDNRYCPTSW